MRAVAVASSAALHALAIVPVGLVKEEERDVVDHADGLPPTREELIQWFLQQD